LRAPRRIRQMRHGFFSALHSRGYFARPPLLRL
jgi:hypothetical protein